MDVMNFIQIEKSGNYYYPVDEMGNRQLFKEKDREKAETILGVLTGMKYASAINLLHKCEEALMQMKVDGD